MQGMREEESINPAKYAEAGAGPYILRMKETAIIHLLPAAVLSGQYMRCVFPRWGTEGCAAVARWAGGERYDKRDLDGFDAFVGMFYGYKG